MPYCECDKCGYIADVPYIDHKCPKCNKGIMKEMTKEQELIAKLKPLFRMMKQDVEGLKQAIDDLYTSIQNLIETLERIRT